MYKVYFYVPKTHLDLVKQAVFKSGAGKLGNYDNCAWQTLGTGQFRALKGANPAVGQQDQLAQVQEYKVETVCEDHLLEQVIQALVDTHPYEAPAYGYWRVTDEGEIILPKEGL